MRDGLFVVRSGPLLAEGVLCFELCEQRLVPPMSDSLFRLAGKKMYFFGVFVRVSNFLSAPCTPAPQNHPPGNNGLSL